MAKAADANFANWREWQKRVQARAPIREHTPSLPDARPHSDRIRFFRWKSRRRTPAYADVLRPFSLPVAVRWTHCDAQCHLGVSHQRFFLFPGAPLGYSVAPFGLGSPRFHRYYEGTTTSPIPSRPLALEACVRLLPLHRLASLALRFDAPALRLDVVNPVSSFPRHWFRQRTGVLPSSQGSLFMHLCHGLGPRQDGAATGLSRCLPHGPRWVYGEDSRIGAFVAQSRGFVAHCQRFVPASRLTTHDSFTAAWLHALPCGILTRWAPSQGFFFCTVLFHMCFGFLSVCALLGAKTPSLPDARPSSDRFRCGGRESKLLLIQPLPED